MKPSGLLLLGVALVIAPVCAVHYSARPTLATHCHDTVSKMAALTSHLTVPEYLKKADAQKQGGEFDVNLYFSVLDHLRMPPSHTLDYVYYGGPSGGEPILYVRPREQPTFQTYADFEAAHGRYSIEVRNGQYIQGIFTDDTPEGFLHLVILRIMGAQFYLFGHALYNDRVILCNQTELEALLTRSIDFGRNLPPSVQAQAGGLDVTPFVNIEPDTASVRLITFTKWGGFIRENHILNRKFPHQTIEVKREELVKHLTDGLF